MPTAVSTGYKRNFEHGDTEKSFIPLFQGNETFNDELYKSLVEIILFLFPGSSLLFPVNDVQRPVDFLFHAL